MENARCFQQREEERQLPRICCRLLIAYSYLFVNYKIVLLHFLPFYGTFFTSKFEAVIR